MSARADAVKAASGGSGQSGQDPRADAAACECRAEWRMLPGEGNLGYRRVMMPGCDQCEPEPDPLPMIVDRYGVPAHRRHAILIQRGGARLSKQFWTGCRPEKLEITLDWSDNGREDDDPRRGMSIRSVNRPAVKVDGRWVRRDPHLVVMA